MSKAINNLLDWTLGAVGASVVMAAALPVLMPGGASAGPGETGEQIFMKKCAGCHMGGKNTINPKHPIIGSKMLASKQAFKTYISKPVAPMPAFPKIAGNDADLTALYDYCKTLK